MTSIGKLKLGLCAQSIQQSSIMEQKRAHKTPSSLWNYWQLMAVGAMGGLLPAPQW